MVYTDHQRLELEKEFHYSRYITIRRKSELAATLGLTERQVRGPPHPTSATRAEQGDLTSGQVAELNGGKIERSRV